MGEKDNIETLPVLFAKWHNNEQQRIGKTRAEAIGFDDRELRHFNIINPLNIGEEGIVVLTNCGGTASILQDPSSNIESVYMVRVKGTVDAALLRKWRTGVKVCGRYYGRVLAQLIKRSDNSSWIRIGLVDKPECSIKDLLHTVDLDIQRYRRQSFGPYLSSKIGEQSLCPLKIHSLLSPLFPPREERDALIPVMSHLTEQRHEDVAVQMPGEP